jgi:glycosyltransferase involved in cell wall biosynthesis
VSAPVAINARAALRREIGGVERVAREMAARLPRLRPDRYRVLAPPRALAHRAGHAWEQGWLPLAARGSRLIYSPANLAPVASRRNVVVIHDLAPLREPGWYGSFYGAYHRRLAGSLARRARVVITVSEFARAELLDLLDVPGERVRVVPNGVDERFSPSADPGPARACHDLTRPYVLVVATDVARKNLSILGEAARRLDERGIDLVVAGSGRGYMTGEGAVGLRRLGYVAEDELPGLYAGAAAFAMPSLYEGFGLPCLEAMASGVPVVAADRAALPETCDGAALLVDPTDPTVFADALLSAATDQSVRERLGRAGVERAAGFSWQRSAELTDAVIAELLSGIT